MTYSDVTNAIRTAWNYKVPNHVAVAIAERKASKLAE